MFIKKDGVSQNHLPVFIMMAVVTIVVMIMISYRSEKYKQKYETQKKIASQKKKNSSLTELFSANSEIFKPNSKNLPKVKTSNLSPEELFNEILSKNMDRNKLVFFYASWNNDCIAMMENIKDISKQNKVEKKIIVVEVEGSVEENSNVEISVNYEKVVCENAVIPAKYEVASVPTSIILGKDNALISRTNGKMNYQEIKNILINN